MRLPRVATLVVAASALGFLPGCAGPAPAEGAASATAEGDAGPRAWDPEELLAAAQGLAWTPPEPDEAERVFRHAAPWALEPREPQPDEAVSVAYRRDVLRTATPDMSVVLVSSHSGSAEAHGPVHALQGTMTWTGGGGAWRMCVVRDGEPLAEVPCVEGASPLALEWRTAAEGVSLPEGVYGIRTVPVGPVSAVHDLEARVEVRWTRFA